MISEEELDIIISNFEQRTVTYFSGINSLMEGYSTILSIKFGTKKDIFKKLCYAFYADFLSVSGVEIPPGTRGYPYYMNNLIHILREHSKTYEDLTEFLVKFRKRLENEIFE